MSELATVPAGRLPDGRVLRVASTAALRRDVESGQVPVTSTVRRSPEEEWMPLEWTREFADLVQALRARPPAGAPATEGLEQQACGSKPQAGREDQTPQERLGERLFRSRGPL